MAFVLNYLIIVPMLYPNNFDCRLKKKMYGVLIKGVEGGGCPSVMLGLLLVAKDIKVVPAIKAFISESWLVE